jgi:hydroxypyruvate isomerase
MPRLSANLTMMFTERPFLERIDAAADAGFRAIECVAPYVAPAEAIRERLQAREMTFALFNMPPGDWDAGDRGMAANPARRDEFKRSVETALGYARVTGCRTLHLMAGLVPADADTSAWTRVLVENIKFAADAVANDGVTLVLEPINTRVDMPGYFYDTTDKALSVMDQAGRANVKLLYDVYHLQIMQGDLVRRLEELLPRVGHIQIADNPGRHEPGTGEINFAWLLPKLDALGYTGWVGCEYRPLARTEDGLVWAAPYLF